jgi:hypothetical protein
MGWRQIVEKMHMTATLTKWYEDRGRHEIFAGGKSVKLDSVEHRMLLREELITQDVQHDLDRLGIAKNAREEQIRARAEKIRLQKENERMAQLYRQHILKEPAPETPSLVQIETRKSPNAQEGVVAGITGD